VSGTAEERHDDGSWTCSSPETSRWRCCWSAQADAAAALYRGQAATDEADRRDYQTMFAREDGAVAAPTAALHFTDGLMAALARRASGTRR
jgi:S-adenosylmethionine:tRNA ribosyltransferase-isomerase